MKAILLSLAVVLIASAQAEACNRCGLFGRHCRFQQHVVHHQKAIVAPIVYQTIYYQVGGELQLQALVQKAVQRDPAYQQLQQFKQFMHNQQHAQPAPQPDGEVPASPELPGNPAVSVLATKCANCHSGDAPKAGILLDGTAPLSDLIRVKASRAVMDGTMPPKERPPLTDQEYSDVLREIITTPNAEGE